MSDVTRVRVITEVVRSKSPTRVVKTIGQRVTRTAVGMPGATGLPGEPGIPGPPGIGGSNAGTYTHVQGVPATVWTVTHNLGFKPSVTVIDTDESEIEGDVSYLNLNTLQITFSVIVAGTAYMS